MQQLFTCKFCDRAYRTKAGCNEHQKNCTIRTSAPKNPIKIKKTKRLEVGKENTSYIQSKFIEQCLKNGIDGLFDYLKMKHFSSNHPENYNVRKRDKDDDRIDYFYNGIWREGNVESIIQRHIIWNIESDFKAFIKQKYTIEHYEIVNKYLKSFMRSCGYALGMDFDNEFFTYEETESCYDSTPENSDDDTEQIKKYKKRKNDLLAINTNIINKAANIIYECSHELTLYRK